MGFAIKHWRLVAMGSVTLIALIGLHSLRVAYIKSAHETELKEQKDALEKACQSAKLITYEVSDDYQKNLTAIDGHLSSVLLRQQTPVCIPITDASSGRDAGQSERPVIHRSHGVDARRLLELAADADKERAQRRACQAYVKQIRKAMDF